jgi:serine/threonine-protein kinase
MARKKLKFGRYEVESELGQGAMGKVYKAFDPLTQRAVAIKALKDEILAQDENGEYQKRFQREARAAGGLSHPNIITVFDVGDNYFVMEYLEGKNLLNLIAEKGKLTLDETLSIVSPIADALAYAHSKGVFHRDIKPANIMVFPDGRPVITDFGLAHLESTVMTAAGQFLGSPSYMSPEQVLGEEITPRADVFSLCVVSYEMLTGHKPFPGENVTSVIYKVVHAAPVPPHELNPELPAEYEHIFARALAKNPAQRFQSFSEFVGALNLEEFDRLEIPAQEQTQVSIRQDVLTTEDEQETVSLPTRAVESQSSITERKRPSHAKRNGLLAAAAAVVLVLTGLVLPRFFTEPVVTELPVATNPEGAEVWIDDALAGMTPFELSSLTLGAHDVRVIKEGFLPLEERIEISDVESAEPLFFSLQPARVDLFIDSVPSGAAVLVDGERAGTTPLEDFELTPGQHDVEVGRRGYETWRSTLVAQAGESVNLEARLRRVAPASAPASAPAAAAPAPSSPSAPSPSAASGDVVELGADDKHPERISGRPPSYPPLARKMNQQGRVTVEFVLTEDGIPEQMQIIESAGTILDQAVMDSLAQWRYSPAEKNGVKVRVKQRVRQTFRLGR